MSQANVDVVKNIYTAFARGDAASALAPMAPEMVWNEAEGFPYADRNPYVGPAAIATGVFMRLATEWDGFQAIPDEFVDGGNTVVVLGRYLGTYKSTGIAINAQFAHIWRVRDGKTVAFQQYTDTAQTSRAANA